MKQGPQLAAGLSSSSQPLRSQFAGVGLDQFGEWPGRNDGERRVEIAQSHGTLALFGKAVQLPVNMHWVDIDKAGLADGTAHALELETTEKPRQHRSDETRLLARFAGGNVLRCKASDRVTLRNDPAATAAAGHQINFHRAISVKPDRQGCDLVEYRRCHDGRHDSLILWRPPPSHTRHISGIETKAGTRVKKGPNR